MGSRTDIKERRLKSIYDALDSGNNKKAISEAEKVIKKDNNFSCAKALRALALYRLGRPDAAVEIESLFNSKPTDESTLQAMAYYYRESHQLEKIAMLYEAAAEKSPFSEELLTTLFMAYVRVLDHKNQQRVAMKLHRLAPSKNPYYFWGVMSIVMQGLEAGFDSAEKLYLPLAEKMIVKYVSEGKVQADAEVQLYLLVLEQRGKWVEALAVLRQPDLRKLIPASAQPTVQRTRLQYLERLGKMRDAAMLCKHLLRNQADDWVLWSKYVHYTLRVLKSCDAEVVRASEEEHLLSSDDDFYVMIKDGSVADVLSFIHEMQYSEGRLRGPRLAELELIKELRCPSEVSEVSEDWTVINKNEIERLTCDEELIRLMVEYFKRHSFKPTLSNDLAQYVRLLPLCAAQRNDEVKTRVDFFAHCEALAPAYESEPLPAAQCNGEHHQHAGSEGDQCGERIVCAVPVSSVLARLNIEQLRRLCTPPFTSAPQREEHLQQLCCMHRVGLQPGLLRTEYQPADGFLLLAAEEMHDAWCQSGEESWIWRCIITLEAGLRHSPSNHYLMLHLARLYGCLGALQPVIRLFERLDVKQIMCDSLGYVVSRVATRTGQFASTSALLNTFTKFFKVNRKDVTEYLCTAYRNGGFRKVPEFVRLSARLASSLEAAFCNLELRCLHVLLSASGQPTLNPQTISSSCRLAERFIDSVRELGCEPDKLPLSIEELRDNRDFSVVPSFEATQLHAASELQDYEAEVQWLRFRCLLLRSMSMLARLVASPLEQDVQLAEKLAQEWDSMRDNGKTEAAKFVSVCSSPHPSLPNTCPLQIYVHDCADDDKAATEESNCMAALLASALRFMSTTRGRPSVQQLLGPLHRQVRRLQRQQTQLLTDKQPLQLAQLLPQLSSLLESCFLAVHTVELAQLSVRPEPTGATVGHKNSRTAAAAAAAAASRPEVDWCNDLHQDLLKALIGAASLMRFVCERFSELHYDAEVSEQKSSSSQLSKAEEMQLVETLRLQLYVGDQSKVKGGLVDINLQSDSQELASLVASVRQTVADSHAASLAELRRSLESCLPEGTIVPPLEQHNGH